MIHLIANSQSMGGTLHVRSTLAGGALSAGTPLMLQGSSMPGCSNDAPSVAVLPDGTIYDATGWLAHSCCVCDTNLFTSLAPDMGAAGWTPGFAFDAYYVSVPSYAYSHELVTLPDAGTALAVWPDEDNTDPTLFDSVDYALSTDFALHDGGPVAPANNGADEVFYSAMSPQQMSWDDWSTCRLTDGDVHLLRHVIEPADAQNLVGAFEEARWNGASWSIASPPPAAVESPSNGGLALASGPDPTRGFLLATIGTDSAIHIAKWTATGGWSQVATVKRSTPPRAIASGGCGSPRPYFLWTEGTSTYTSWNTSARPGPRYADAEGISGQSGGAGNRPRLYGGFAQYRRGDDLVCEENRKDSPDQSGGAGNRTRVRKRLARASTYVSGSLNRSRSRLPAGSPGTYSPV